MVLVLVPADTYIHSSKIRCRKCLRLALKLQTRITWPGEDPLTFVLYVKAVTHMRSVVGGGMKICQHLKDDRTGRNELRRPYVETEACYPFPCFYFLFSSTLEKTPRSPMLCPLERTVAMNARMLDTGRRCEKLDSRSETMVHRSGCAWQSRGC